MKTTLIILVLILVSNPCFSDDKKHILDDDCKLHLSVAGYCSTCVTGFEIEKHDQNVFVYLVSANNPWRTYVFKDIGESDNYYLDIINKEIFKERCDEKN